jgi:type I restriction enzyme S subunit
MREMKDSGIEWVKSIPNNWEVKKGKYCLQCVQKPVKKDDDVITCFRDGEVTLRSKRREDGFTISMKEIGYQGIDVGDLIVHGMDGFAGAIGISDSRGKASPVLNVLETNNNKRYIMYYLRSMAYNGIFLALSTGVRVRTCDTNWGKLRELLYIIPPKNDQDNIVSYLDSKCSEIDSLTDDIQSQIITLEEYKKSIISEVVAKGLDSNVDMKDSGIEWVGTIPKHWIVEKIKYHLQRKEPRNPGDVQVLSVYREYGVIPKDSRDDNHNVTSEDTSKYKYVKPGNLVINKMKAWQGSLAISEYEGIVSPAYFIYHFIDDVFNKKYFHYLIRSCYKDEFRRISTGIREGQWDLPSRDFENELVLIPPKNEQNDIVNYLDSKCSEIDAIIQTKKEQLDVLAEYKKSLIYEYVTGKKEVPVNE